MSTFSVDQYVITFDSLESTMFKLSRELSLRRAEAVSSHILCLFVSQRLETLAENHDFSFLLVGQLAWPLLADLRTSYNWLALQPALAAGHNAKHRMLGLMVDMDRYYNSASARAHFSMRRLKVCLRAERILQEPASSFLPGSAPISW